MPNSATGETHARQPNQATTTTPNAIMPPPAARARRCHKPGTAANTAKPSANSAGPHVQQLNFGPSSTASHTDTTRRNDATTVMSWEIA
ncbi:MAG: hypothetical protein NTW21_14755 [Verrucomicrobia bacterium]|nr:hypothetical protein [Verrucomicrobiota bacterium]